MALEQNAISLNMVLSGLANARRWNIRITQIPCGANYMGRAFIFIKTNTKGLKICNIFSF